MRTDGKNPKVLMERAIEFQALASSLDIWGERQSSADMFRKSLQLVESVAQLDPGYNRIRERLAKTHVLLGFQLSRTAELAEAEKQMKDGIEQYANAVSAGRTAGLDPRHGAVTIPSRRSSRLYAAISIPPEANFQLGRDAEAPLAKADPQNMMLRMDMIGFDFECAAICGSQGAVSRSRGPRWRN